MYLSGVRTRGSGRPPLQLPVVSADAAHPFQTDRLRRPDIRCPLHPFYRTVPCPPWTALGQRRRWRLSIWAPLSGCRDQAISSGKGLGGPPPRSAYHGYRAMPIGQSGPNRCRRCFVAKVRSRPSMPIRYDLVLKGGEIIDSGMASLPLGLIALAAAQNGSYVNCP